MHKMQRTVSDPTAKVGMSKKPAACKQNMAKKTRPPPILSESTGHRNRPAASETEMMTTKAAATAAEAPPIEPAITLASERIASPAVVLRKNMAHRPYTCQVMRASLRRHAPLPEPRRSMSSASVPPESPASLLGYRTNHAAQPMRR